MSTLPVILVYLAIANSLYAEIRHRGGWHVRWRVTILVVTLFAATLLAAFTR